MSGTNIITFLKKPGLEKNELEELVMIVIITDLMDLDDDYYLERRKELMLKATDDQKEYVEYEVYGNLHYVFKDKEIT